MSRVRRTILLLVICFIVFVPPTVHAASRAEKDALLDEVVTALDGASLIARFLDPMFMGITGEESDHVRLDEMPAEQRLDYEQELKQANEKRRVFREKIMLHLDAEALAAQVLRPLLDESFSEQELKDLLGFLKTGTGAKTVAFIPEMTTRLTTGLMFGESQAMREAIEKAELDMAGDGGDMPGSMKRTMADMRSMATASEAYAVDHDAYPDADTLDELAGLVSPDYIRELPRTDGWGNEYRYFVSADRMHYRLVSAGEDGVFAWDSTVALDEAQISRLPQHTSTFNDDLIYQNGMFLQYPESAER